MQSSHSSSPGAPPVTPLLQQAAAAAGSRQLKREGEQAPLVTGAAVVRGVPASAAGPCASRHFRFGSCARSAMKSMSKLLGRPSMLPMRPGRRSSHAAICAAIGEG